MLKKIASKKPDFDGLYDETSPLQQALVQLNSKGGKNTQNHELAKFYLNQISGLAGYRNEALLMWEVLQSGSQELMKMSLEKDADYFRGMSAGQSIFDKALSAYQELRGESELDKVKTLFRISRSDDAEEGVVVSVGQALLASSLKHKLYDLYEFLEEAAPELIQQSQDNTADTEKTFALFLTSYQHDQNKIGHFTTFAKRQQPRQEQLIDLARMSGKRFDRNTINWLRESYAELFKNSGLGSIELLASVLEGKQFREEHHAELSVLFQHTPASEFVRVEQYLPELFKTSNEQLKENPVQVYCGSIYQRKGFVV